jgi:hypothetical protein
MVFNEWNDNSEHLLEVIDVDHAEEDEEEEKQEAPPKLAEALEMLRKLHLLVSVEQPQLHKLVTDLQSKLADIYLESMTTKQSSITDYFKRV